MLPLALGLGGLAIGGLSSLAGIGQADRLQRDIRERYLNQPPLSGQNMFSPAALQALGISPEQARYLSGQAGGAAIGLGASETARMEGLRQGDFSQALGAIQGMQTEPWSQQAQQGMISASREGINQASRAGIEQMRQGAASRGVGRGRWLMGQEQQGRMAAGGERARATRELESTRSRLSTDLTNRRQELLGQLHAGRQRQGFDWSSYLAPAMNWPLQAAGIEMGAGQIPINALMGFGSGAMQGGGNIMAARAMPTPQAPSGLAGLFGGVAAGAGQATKIIFAGCVSGEALVPTTGGVKPLKFVQAGEHALGSDGNYHQVLFVDYGPLAPEQRAPHVRMTTVDGHSIVLTRDHPIAGVPIQRLDVGGRVRWGVRGACEIVKSIEPMDYVPSGTIVLDGCPEFVADGFPCDCLTHLYKEGLEALRQEGHAA